MLVEHKKCNASPLNPQAATLKALLTVSVVQNSDASGLEFLNGIVYRALQALGCAAASIAERETANYQGRVSKRQPTTPIEETQ